MHDNNITNNSATGIMNVGEHSGNSKDGWSELMRNGNFEAAWQHSDRVMEKRKNIPCWHLPRHLQYIWDGSPLTGKRVLVRCYHGLGDTIQFIRYASVLKTIASQVIVWAQPELICVLNTVEGIDILLPLHDGIPDAEYDMDIEVMELPHIFRTTLKTIPLTRPYLHIRKDHLLPNRYKYSIGLVWKGGNWDENRSIPFSFLYPLAAIPGITFYILQQSAAKAGWNNEFGVYVGEFALYEYAQHIAELDLLISVDSMPVHLAGALGVPVWTLLQANADWRWMDRREDSPWYPSMRLFRQERQGEWQPVIQRIVTELKREYNHCHRVDSGSGYIKTIA